MSVRRRSGAARRAAFLLAWSVAVPCTGNASSSAAPVRIDPSVDAVQAAAHRPETVDCQTSQCRAVRTIAEALDTYMEATAATNGVPRPIPLDRDSAAKRKMDGLVSRNADNAVAICKTASDIGSRYSLPAVSGDLFVPVSLLRFALAIDARTNGSCLSDVLAALPQTEAANTAIDHARALCENVDKNGGLACGKIRRS